MKTGRLRYAWLAAVLVVLGCAHSEREESTRPPLPTISLRQVVTFSGHDRIEANGVDEYIAAYHEAGWLRALNDARLLEPLTYPANVPHEGNHPSLFRFPLRVKDVFCFYYIRSHDEQSAIAWKSDATWDERDAIAALIVAEIQRNGTTDKTADRTPRDPLPPKD